MLVIGSNMNSAIQCNAKYMSILYSTKLVCISLIAGSSNESTEVVFADNKIMLYAIETKP